MVHPHAKIISDLRKDESWNMFQKISAYFNSYRKEYTTVEQTEIEDEISRKEEYFNPEDCSMVEHASISFENHPDLLTFNREKAIGLCEEAKHHNTSLPTWIYGTYTLHGKEPTDFSLKVHKTSAYEAEMARKMGISMKSEAIPMISEKSGIVSLEIDKIGLIGEIQKLRQEFTEESENLRTALEKRIAQLNEAITARKEGRPIPADVETPYSITMSYSPGEYSVFTKVIRISPAVDIRILGRTKSEIRVKISGDERIITKITDETARRYGNIVSVKPAPPGGPVVDTLCGRYTSLTKLPCNNAVRQLGSRINEFFREMFGQYYDVQTVEGLIDSVDLFPGSTPGRYTAEMADEAYGAFVASLRSEMQRDVGGANIALGQGECSDDIYYENLVDYAALTDLMNSGEPYRSSQEIRDAIRTHLSDLRHCGFSDIKMMTIIENANSFFIRTRNQYFDDLVMDRVKSYRKKYGGVENSK